MMSVPGHEHQPHFEVGSGSSDVLHALLHGEGPPFTHLFGHSKGALVIQNAIRDLPTEKREPLHVITFGCPIREEAEGVKYLQVLGAFDALGQANAWGNGPEIWLPAHHATNTDLPLHLPVVLLTRFVQADQFEDAPQIGLPPSAAAVMALGAPRR